MLRCEECGVEAAEASHGWRALHAHDEGHALRVVAAIFCPAAPSVSSDV